MNEQAVKCTQQFNSSVTLVQVQRKMMSVRQIGQPKAEFSFLHFRVSHFQRPHA